MPPVGNQLLHSAQRRRFTRILVCLALGEPALAAFGQGRSRALGLLQAGRSDNDDSAMQLASLRLLGWVEGRNLRVERRFANGQLELLSSLAEELVRAKVDVILANGPNPTRAAMRATTTIPIVFGAASDPVRSGLVESLARPGGNVTGFSMNIAGVTSKLLALLKQMSPGVTKVGMLAAPGNPQVALTKGGLDIVFRSVGVEAVYADVPSIEAMPDVLARMARQGIGALLLIPDSFILRYRTELISVALNHRLPTVSFSDDFARDGALISYSASGAEATQRTAYYVDRILRGARPADLPVEEPARFTLAINLRTARALGITIPRDLLLQADELIE
jgi:putative tryptophan/tyrosine transport system substrate-binding protein